MSNLMTFPNKRISRPSLLSPVFEDDIVSSNESLIKAICAILGLDYKETPDTANLYILSGFTYAAGSYSSGIVYMGGLIYFYNSADGLLLNNQYLVPSTVDVEAKVYSDTNPYETYRTYVATPSGSQFGTFPVFTGNMNAYRLGSAYLKTLTDLVTPLNTDFYNYSYSYRQVMSGGTAFNTNLNVNVNFVDIDYSGSGSDNYIQLPAASSITKGRRVVFNINYNGQGFLTIRDIGHTVDYLTGVYIANNRIVIFECIQTGASTYDWVIIQDVEVYPASNVEVQGGQNEINYVTPLGLHTHAAWITLTVDADFTGNLYCRKDNEGIVHLRGQVTGSSIEGGIGALASGYRPAIQQTFKVIATDGDDASVIVYTNGAILTSLTGGSRTISLDGIYFFTD